MTTTTNRAQILRNTRETLEHTLRFFHTVNEQLRNFVDQAHTHPVTPRTIEDITKICTDFHRDQDIRITELNKIWNDFTTTPNRLPTDLPTLFNPEAITRLNREIMDHTIRFFTVTNEALIKGQMPQHDQILPRQIVETINLAIQDFQKTQTDFTRTFEHTFQNILKTVAPTTPLQDKKSHQEEPTMHPQKHITDEVFTLNRDIIENTIHFILNLNEHTTAIIENIDHKNVEKHAELITRIHDEFVRNRKIMVERFDTFIHRTAETLSTLRPETLTTPGITPLFDHQEVLKINQNVIAGTVKYFTTITETLLQEPRPQQRETILRATEEFHKHHQVLATRFATILTEVGKHLMTNIDQRRTVVNTPETTTKNQEAGHTTTTTPRPEKKTTAHTTKRPTGKR